MKSSQMCGPFYTTFTIVPSQSLWRSPLTRMKSRWLTLLCFSSSLTCIMLPRGLAEHKGPPFYNIRPIVLNNNPERCDVCQIRCLICWIPHIHRSQNATFKSAGSSFLHKPKQINWKLMFWLVCIIKSVSDPYNGAAKLSQKFR